MTNALLTKPWTTASVREDGTPLTLDNTHEEVIRLVLWPAGNDKHSRYNVTNNASMSDFVDDVLMATWKHTGQLIKLSDAESAIREVLASGLLHVNEAGWLMKSRSAYRALGLRPPFWVRK